MSEKALEVIKFDEWIEKVKHLLQPPVGNKMLYGEGQIQAFIVGGPNTRKDFHIEDGEEFFYQLKGDMRVDIMEKGKLRRVPIKEGQVLRLPANIPHSPQRFPDTIGLVVERQRGAHEFDGLRWYVGETSEILYEEFFNCKDLATEIKEAIERFFKSDDYKSGKPSRTFTDPKVKIDEETVVDDPFYLNEWIQNNPDNSILFSGEMSVTVARPKDSIKEWKTHNGEYFFYQLEGNAVVKAKKVDGEEVHTFNLPPQSTLLIPNGYSFTTERTDGKGLEVFIKMKN